MYWIHEELFPLPHTNVQSKGSMLFLSDYTRSPAPDFYELADRCFWHLRFQISYRSRNGNLS